MPRSKRSKIVSLSQTEKGGKEAKAKLIQRIRDASEAFPFIYVIRVQNDRNAIIKELREQWNDSKFFFGKNAVMQVALGRSEVDEHLPGVSAICGRVHGRSCGLLFTARPAEQVCAFFAKFSRHEFARAGCVAAERVHLAAGELPQFSHAIEPYLRELGLPTRLNKGVVTLDADHVICEVGDTLGPNECRALKVFEKRLAQFRIILDSVYHNGAVSVLEGGHQYDGEANEYPSSEEEMTDAPKFNFF